MTSTKPTRRPLDFRSLREVPEEVERLQRDGYDKVGNWDLAQICGHLSEWLRFPLDGYPMKPFPWILRKTVGKWMLKGILRKRAFPVGIKTKPETIPPADSDPTEAIAKLRQVIDRFEAATVLLPSPVFDKMTHEQWAQFQCVHCAHHLSFLVPKSA